MTILVQQQLREATERLIAEGENCWPATVERFTELANPAAVLALLDEIDRLERHKLALDDLLESYQVAQREVADLEEKCQLLALHGELAAADADWASDDGKEAAKERDRLKAENAELRKDKDRLDHGYIMTGTPGVDACEHRGMDLRASIDRVTQLDEQRVQRKAMTKEQQS